MFDMGFTELMLIGIVALVVIGPERLPGVARTAGKYVGRLKRFMTTVKADVEQELRADELRQILTDQQKELDSLKDSITEAGRSVEKEFGPDDVKITEAAPEMTATAPDVIAPDVIQETPLPDPVSEKVGANAAAKKPAAGDSDSNKAASKKAAVKKPVSKKAAVKKSTAKITTARKPAAKKAAPKKAAPIKTTSDSAK